MLLAPAVGVTPSEDDTKVGDAVVGDAVVGALVLPPPQADIETAAAIKTGESNEFILFMSIPRIVERATCRSRRDDCNASSDKHRRHLNKTNSYMRIIISSMYCLEEIFKPFHYCFTSHNAPC